MLFSKLYKALSNPVKYMQVKYLLREMSIAFQNKAFFMQGQMDINPASLWYNDSLVQATGGYYVKDDKMDRKICDLEPYDNTRRDMLVLLLRTILEKNIPGDIAELGVYKGYTAKLIHHYLPERELHCFDTFEGFTKRSVVAERANTNFEILESHFSDTSVDLVRKNISPVNNNVFLNVGYFPDSIPEGFDKKHFSFVHLDADLYEPIFAGLKFFYPRLSSKGMIVVHDYNAWLGARKAVDDFFLDKNEMPIPMPDKSGSALIIKF